MDNQNILKKIRDIHFSFSEFAVCCPELLKLKEIPQNAEYHAEGDVYRHTEMVCEKLVELSEWKQLESEEQEILFLSAAFHDIGKVNCTKKEDGKWVSPKHTIVGEKEFRAMVYRRAERFGLTFAQRELAAGEDVPTNVVSDVAESGGEHSAAVVVSAVKSGCAGQKKSGWK